MTVRPQCLGCYVRSLPDSGGKCTINQPVEKPEPGEAKRKDFAG